MTTLWIVLGALLLIALYAVSVYNSLVRLSNLVKEAWSGIDVQLKKRHDLVPNVVETVKGYATHEKGVFEKVSTARSASIQATGLPGVAQAENMLTQSLRQLFAVAEAYPELKANTNFLELQRQLSSIEESIEMARRYYNGAAREMNIAIQSFPSSLVAGPAGFKPAAYFEIEAASREVPQVKL